MEPGDLASHPWSFFIFCMNLGHFCLLCPPSCLCHVKVCNYAYIEKFIRAGLSRCSVAARHYPLCPTKLEQILVFLSAQIRVLEQQEQRFRSLCIPSAHNSLAESKPSESSLKNTHQILLLLRTHPFICLPHTWNPSPCPGLHSPVVLLCSMP